MKIAILSDVHGNYPALVKVVADARANQVEQFVFVGDYIFDLPFTNEVAELLMGMDNARVIKGNKEEYLVDWSKSDQRDWIYDQLGGMYQTFRDCSKESLDYLLRLPEECYLPLDNGDVLYATHFLKDCNLGAKKIFGSSSFHKRMRAEPFGGVSGGIAEG